MTLLRTLRHFPRALIVHGTVLCDYDAAVWLECSWAWASVLAERPDAAL